ncbi:hypothetical protein F1734_17510 [Rhodococcus ruber]|uniref:hypothetical protein n=1 Tax=Rhodococcus ruber TaxID=1830 RepID=UPI00193321C4|nr:hypothetical protein [Rhodococcus ruber]QRE81864.1 hypothetical protein F1734_17510 [Rhodococcus ruber]
MSSDRNAAHVIAARVLAEGDWKDHADLAQRVTDAILAAGWREPQEPTDHDVELRRQALQSSAELWRGLDILDRELRAGKFTSARDTVQMLRAVVRIQDATIQHLTARHAQENR